MRTRVKICGICQVDDALAAAHFGADAIGMVFHPDSRRNVAIDLAERIVAALPPFVTPVGLFVDAPAAHIAQVCQRLGLNHVQLHGHESAAAVAEVIALTHASVLKAIRVDRSTMLAELAGWREAISRPGMDRLKGLVLETATSSAPGGTGLANDWETVRSFQVQGAFEGLPRLIAAGGLTPDNVAGVVTRIRPWAVDVSSGVELVRGQKSPQKIQAFIEAVRSVQEES